MKVLLNTTTLYIGGALQLGTSLTYEALHNPCGMEWHFAMSRAIYDQLRRFHDGELPNAEVFDESPANSRAARRRLAALEADLQLDGVLTPYGPAYVQFAAPHLMGAANPWVAHADIHAYRIYKSPREWLSVFLLSIYRGYWFRRADMLVVESEYVRQGYHRRIGVPLDHIAVVANTCGKHYLEQQGVRPFPVEGQRVRILCFAAPHRHKRVEIVARVAKELRDRRPDLSFEFVTTVPSGHEVYDDMMAAARKLGVESSINNLGQVSVADGPQLYQSCDICFMPTVLECFSATYPEAMAMGLPIVTTDLGFIRDVCHDAALYFPPDNAAAAADQIIALLSDESQWSRLIENGKEILAVLPAASDKYIDYVHLLERVIRRVRTSRGRSGSRSEVKDRTQQ